MAEDRSLTAGEDGGHEAAVEAQAAVAYGVDALMDAMEASSLRALGHRVATQANLFELRQRENTVLASGDLSHASISRVAFVAHVSTKATGLDLSPCFDFGGSKSRNPASMKAMPPNILRSLSSG